jgi:hypothetical protein
MSASNVNISISNGWLAVIGVAALVALGLVIVAVVDVAPRPRTQLTASQKTLWILGLGLGFVFVWPAAAVMAVVYLTVVRKRLRAMALPGLSQATWDPYAGGAGGRPPDLPPAGWYVDPAGQGQRWWDGRGWSEHVRPPP